MLVKVGGLRCDVGAVFVADVQGVGGPVRF